MNKVTVEGKEYDLDAVSPEARAQIEQLLFLTYWSGQDAGAGR